MRVMVLVKATDDSETGRMPSTDELNEMGRFNDQLIEAGIMLAADGLHSSSSGKRVRFTDKKSTVVDGPFAETKELVAGFWIWQVSSMDEAVEWIRRAPFADNEIELRRIIEAEDFGDAFTLELQEKEQQQRARLTDQ